MVSLCISLMTDEADAQRPVVILIVFVKVPVKTFAPFYIGVSTFFSSVCMGYSYFLHSSHVHICCKYLLLCALSLSNSIFDEQQLLILMNSNLSIYCFAESFDIMV